VEKQKKPDAAGSRKLLFSHIVANLQKKLYLRRRLSATFSWAVFFTQKNTKAGRQKTVVFSIPALYSCLKCPSFQEGKHPKEKSNAHLFIVCRFVSRFFVPGLLRRR
jgi:hypothetical protein